MYSVRSIILIGNIGIPQQRTRESEIDTPPHNYYTISDRDMSIGIW